MKKHTLYAAIVAGLGMATVTGAQAAAVNNGDILHVTGATYNTTGYVTSGSYFGMDMSSDLSIQTFEKTGLSEGTSGLVIGITTPQGSSHTGVPTASDTNAVDKPWLFFCSTGSDYLRVAATGDTTGGLNMSGWTVTWSNIPAIDMGTNAWQPLNCTELGCAGHTFTSGYAQFIWDGVYGDGYTLNYAAVVPRDGLTNFGGVHYFLHLEGTVQSAVPIPAAIWLLGSGLMSLVSVARRKRRASI